MNHRIQSRSEENGIRFHTTLKEAMETADNDTSIHTISFDVGQERVVFHRTGLSPGLHHIWYASVDTSDNQDDSPRRYRGRRRAEIQFDSTGNVIP